MKGEAWREQKESAVSEWSYQIRLNKTPAAEQRELLELCMKGKGYHWLRVA